MEDEEYRSPYEDYELFDVEVVETVKKKFCVMAKDAKSAKDWMETQMHSIDMTKDIDEYHSYVVVCDWCGSSDYDYCVPEWWYGDDEE